MKTKKINFIEIPAVLQGEIIPKGAKAQILGFDIRLERAGFPTPRKFFDCEVLDGSRVPRINSANNSLHYSEIKTYFINGKYVEKPNIAREYYREKILLDAKVVSQMIEKLEEGVVE